MDELRPRVMPVLLFTGTLYKELAVFENSKEAMEKKWGPVLVASEPFEFRHSDYYADEMGESLTKVFTAFSELIAPDDLARIKRESNEIEEIFSSGGCRAVNIDPGYIALSKLVLASTKDYAHRLYLGNHIYGEVTLRYTDGTFQPLEWTYPDYREPLALEFFNHARKLYSERLKLHADRLRNR